MQTASTTGPTRNATPTQPGKPGGSVPVDAPRTLDDVPGWLNITDQLLFEWLLSRRTGTGSRGDLLEIGVFQGRSAIHMGRFRRPGDKFTVCDLFDLARDEETIRPGARKAYSDLTQQIFERNYLAFHDMLPVIVRGRSDIIVDHVAAASCRFVHIDGSHMYEHVRGDLESARKLMRPDGIIVFDDYRTEHTPGTAGAVWEAMATNGLRVICVTAHKFYGTWDDPTELQDELIAWIAGRTDHRCDLQNVMGQRLVRVVRPAKKPAAATAGETDAQKLLAQSRQALRTAHDMLAKLSGGDANRAGGRAAPVVRQGWRRAAVRLLPPIITDSIRRTRRRRAVRR
jgi:SAM-dependent methyltransferase